MHSFEGIFGYESGVKGYKIRDKTGKYHVSRDVIFDEDFNYSVPFQIEHKNSPNITSARHVLPDNPISFSPPKTLKCISICTECGQAWSDGIEAREWHLTTI